LLDDSVRLNHMRERARAIGRPDAAQKIVDILLNHSALPPIEISKEHQQYMIDVSRGVVLAPQNSIWPDGKVALFDQRTGVLLGAITEEQFGFLSAQLEQESDDDDDFYINAALIESLRLIGADAELLDLLQQALGPGGEGDIRWDRR
jgi:hypothetical protein